MLALHISSILLLRTRKQNITMRSKHKIAAGLLGILMVFASPASLANLLSEDSAVKSEYMEAQRDSEVYSLIGEHVIPVGEVKQGQLIQIGRAHV